MDIFRDQQVDLLLPANSEVASACVEITGLLSLALAKNEPGSYASSQEYSSVDFFQSYDGNAGKESELDSMSRNMMLYGETSTIFLLVGPAKSAANSHAAHVRGDLVSISRALEFKAIPSGFSVSMVNLCPLQPPYKDSYEDDFKVDQAGDVRRRLRKIFADVYAIYFFTARVPEWGKNPPTELSKTVTLDIQCRVQLRRKLTSMAKAAAIVYGSTLGEPDDETQPSSLFDTSENEVKLWTRNRRQSSSISAYDAGNEMCFQTMQVCKTFELTRLVSIRHRIRKINNRHFVEASFKNLNSEVPFELRWVTVHCRTTRGNHTAFEVGRRRLPQWVPPNCTEVTCFEFSSDVDFTGVPNDEGNSIYLVATCSTPILFTCLQLSAKIRMCLSEDNAPSPVDVNFEYPTRSSMPIRSGNMFEIILKICSKCDFECDIHVMMPQKLCETSNILPLDASIYVGMMRSLGQTRSVSVRFLAMESGVQDLSQLILMYDAKSNEIYTIKEVMQVYVLEQDD